jgi:glycine cleavage system aminomethyltransferase T
LWIEYSAFEPGQAGLYEMGTELEYEILGELYKTTVIGESPYDPSNEKLRA